MSQILFANNAATTIASAISSSATTITLASGTGALFPSPSTHQYFKATLYPATAGTQLPEIVHVTARSSDTLTVVRGQEGTTAQVWGAGAPLDNLITAATVNVLPQQVTYAGNPNGYVAGTTGTSSVPPSQVWDSVNSLIWVCTSTGPAATASWAALAPLNSPTFTGTPAAPTPLTSDNSTTLATTAFVKNFAAPIAGNSSQTFNVANGTGGNQAVNAGQFLASAASPGYQKLPSGIIIQWGTNAVGASSFVTFPIPFPTACLCVTVSEANATSATWGLGRPTVHGSQSPTTTGYSAWAEAWTGSGWTGGSIAQSYIAIGF